jgi:hypothetical protein
MKTLLARHAVFRINVKHCNYKGWRRKGYDRQDSSARVCIYLLNWQQQSAYLCMLRLGRGRQRLAGISYKKTNQGG